MEATIWTPAVASMSSPEASPLQQAVLVFYSIYLGLLLLLVGLWRREVRVVLYD
jgi:hypothetical protein